MHLKWVSIFQFTWSSYFQDGAFLVRKSQRGGDCNPYTLTLLYSGHVYNLHTRKRKDGKFALGTEKPDEHVSFAKLSYFNLKISSISFHILNEMTESFISYIQLRNCSNIEKMYRLANLNNSSNQTVFFQQNVMKLWKVMTIKFKS